MNGYFLSIKDRCQKGVILLAMFLVTWFSSISVHASEFSELMQRPGVMLMMRHAYAPGVGDPPNLKIGDCSTQRNLNQQGIDQAKKIGLWLTSQGVTNAQVFTSPWCRCIDTATQLHQGKPQILEAIASTFNETDYVVPAKKNLTQWMVSNQRDQVRGPTILVTHQVNILAYTGFNTSSGELVLIQVDAQGKPTILKTLNPSAIQ
jgi:phosphohistidine phosphatase SixA